MYIIVVGGGKVGYNLAKALLAEGHEVVLIERERARYQELSEELAEAVVQGDGAEVTVLRDLGANRADLVIAVTGEDEDNLVICQMAKIMFINPRTVARVNDPSNEELFTRLGVDMTVNTTNIISALIGHKLKAGVLIPLLTLRGGNTEIVQAELSSRSPAARKMVKDLVLPKDSLLIAAIRKGEAVILRGDTVLEPEDTVIALTSRAAEEELRRLL
jgi:trk system potassium uptake protein TrkA